MKSAPSLLASACICACSIPVSAFAATMVVGTSAGANTQADAVGNGTWTQNNQVGTWTLTSTTGSMPGQGFRNGSLTGGASGLEYTMNHDWNRTDDGAGGTLGNGNPINNPPAINNSVTFSWAGNAGQRIRLSQSAYNNGTGWNGGAGNTGAQFTLTWAGGGSSSFFDPGNDLDDSNTAADDFFNTGSFGSGTVFRQPVAPLQSRNNTDDWFIDLPVGVTSVTVDYSNYDGGGNVHELANEWLSFDIIPEPSRAVLLLLGTSAMILRRKRRS